LAISHSLIETHEDDDAAIVLAVQRGDIDAYATLFHRHHPAVRRACARRLRDLGEADEVAQAAFVRALERIDRCGGYRRFGAWVQVIAQRLCIDAMRARTRTTPHEQPVNGDIELGPNAPEDRVLELDRAAALREALATLSPRQRDVVVARDLEERRPPEIAAALGLSLGAVDSLLLRARRRLAGAYRAAAGEQGISTTASTAAVAGSTIAAGNRGLLATVADAARAVRDAVAHVPAFAAAAPAATDNPAARRVATTAVAAALSLAGLAGGPATSPAQPPVLPAASAIPPVTAVPLPRIDAPSTPAAPDATHLVPLSALPDARPPALAAPAVDAPAPPVSPVAASVTAVRDGVVGVVRDVTSSVGVAVGGLTDTLTAGAPVAP
jgi:RNA polymerase sigma-70 factor (ECF subfamily)